MAKQPVKWFSLKYLASIGLLALVHLFVSRLNFKLSLAYPLVTPIWITAGIELAAMIVYGYRVWPGIFIGSILGHVATFGSSFLLPVGATLEALGGAYLINKFARGTKAFDTAAGVFRFVFLACICSPLISPTFGVGRLYLVGKLHFEDAVRVWLTWWLAHGIGVLLVAPFLILLLRAAPKGWDAFKLGELAVLLLGLIFVCLLVFGPLSVSLNDRKIIAAWLCIPFLIWAAFRFRPLEATGTTLILFGSAIWGTVQGYGSFLATSLTTSLLLLDTFIGVIGTMTLVIAAMVAERNLAEEALLSTQRLLQTAAEEKERDLIVTVQALEVETTGHAQTKTALRVVHERLRRITPNTKLGGKS